MKVTRTRLKLLAVYETVKIAATVLKTTYLRFYVSMMEAYLKNADIRWK